MLLYRAKLYFSYDMDVSGKSINDLTYVSDTAFSILDVYNTERIDVGDTTPDNARVLAESAVAASVDAIYNMPPGSIYKNYSNLQYAAVETLISYFPSIETHAKNAYSIWRASDVWINWCLYVPDLKTVFSTRDYGTPVIYRVNDSLSLTYVSTAQSIGIISNRNYPDVFALDNLAVYNYSSPADFLDTSKMFNLRVSGIAYRTPPYYSVLFRTALSTTLTTIFGSDPSAIVPPTVGPLPPVNPFEPVPPAGPGNGPPGTFNPGSDPIPLPTIPTLSSADTGFTRIYNPTLSQVQALARYLWTEESVIETIWNHIKQIFENPMQAIIGFNLVPCVVPDGGAQPFALMYINTGVVMNTAASQFVDVDCGTYKLEGYYGSALDHAPYTKVSCFLPYIGTVSLDTDEVMNTTLHVVYRIDIVSGSCVAHILVDDSVLYQYSGHCAINIPVSSADFSSYVSAVMSIAKLGIDTAVGSGNVAAHVAKEAQQQTNSVTTTTINEKRTEINPETGRQRTSGTTTRTIVKSEPRELSSTHASFAGMVAENVTNTVSAIMGSKPHIQHSGSFTGNSGYLGVRRPYLIIERPNICLPATYQSMNGFPSMISLVLGDCNGYTQVYQLQLTGLTATNPEQAEILELLKSGVIL